MACQLAGAFQRAGGLAIWDQITDAVGLRRSSVVACSKTIGQLYLDGEKIAISSVPRADGICWGARKPRAENLVLPISVESDNLSLATAVIQRLSAQNRLDV